ncbi:MAG: RDD family protein, partial [Candidatus Thermoplasmatota archaeon]|nr:RDD family protein [Candidatus Thermoplasmatota archaeon]
MIDGQSEGTNLKMEIDMVTGFDLLHDNKPLQKHWIKRLIAYLIDFIVSSMLIYLVFFFLTIGLLDPSMIWYFPMTAGMVQVFYSAALEYASKKTIGKAIMKIEVESLTYSFETSDAIIRNLSKLHGILVLLDWVAGMASEGDPRQRYLDRLTETTVKGIGEPLHVREFIDDHLFRDEVTEER